MPIQIKCISIANAMLHAPELIEETRDVETPIITPYIDPVTKEKKSKTEMKKESVTYRRWGTVEKPTTIVGFKLDNSHDPETGQHKQMQEIPHADLNFHFTGENKTYEVGKIYNLEITPVT